MSAHLSKTDSEVSSLSHSSPGRSPPRRPVYYVQSPSRDSHDGEKTTNSFHSTPAALSPMGSPPHSHSNSSLGPHSRESSSTRFSGSYKPNKKGTSNNNDRKTKKQPWHNKEFDAIEEEGLLDDGSRSNGFPRRCYFPAFVLGFFLLFTFFSLILYGASKPQKPKITMKSITFSNFVVQAGADHSGVATEMVSLNATIKLTYRNTGTFFGVHVSSTPLDLSYSQLTLASGMMRKFYQSRSSQRLVKAIVTGSKIPLYGGGATLMSLKGTPIDPVPLTLNFRMRSRAYVLGRLVKPKFYKKIACSLVMDPKKMNKAISLKKNCTYN